LFDRKKWLAENPERIKAYRQKYRETHRKERNQLGKQIHRKLIEKLKKEIGSNCIVCGSEKRTIYYHEKKFAKHSYSKAYILSHKNDFVPICFRCHRTIHHFKQYQRKFEKLIR